jgi:hypothetical protein
MRRMSLLRFTHVYWLPMQQPVSAVPAAADKAKKQQLV